MRPSIFSFSLAELIRGMVGRPAYVGAGQLKNARHVIQSLLAAIGRRPRRSVNQELCSLDLSCRSVHWLMIVVAPTGGAVYQVFPYAPKSFGNRGIVLLRRIAHKTFDFQPLATT